MEKILIISTFFLFSCSEEKVNEINKYREKEISDSIKIVNMEKALDVKFKKSDSLINALIKSLH